MDEKRLRDQLLKLGSTPFECDDKYYDKGDGITIPIKINSADAVAVAAEAAINQRQMRERSQDDFEIRHSNRKNANIITHLKLVMKNSSKPQLKWHIENICPQ